MKATAKKHSFFDGLDDRHIQTLEKVSFTAHFRPGERLFHQGEPHGHLYLIYEGRVAIQAYAPGRGGKTIDTAGPDDYVGWSWVVAPYRSHYDAVAEEQVVAKAIDAAALRALCEEDHELGYRVLSRMTKLMEQRLRGTEMLLLDLYGTSQ